MNIQSGWFPLPIGAKLIPRCRLFSRTLQSPANSFCKFPPLQLVDVSFRSKEFSWTRQSRPFETPKSSGFSGLKARGGIIDKTKVDDIQQRNFYRPRIDDSGGGDNGGGRIFKGGGGDDDGGDDDFFDFNEGEDDGNKDGWLHQVFPENYSKVAIEAILDEWFHTITGLPLWLRSLVEMGLLSSQQLARFLTLDRRPNFVRNVFRNLPLGLQRELVGRLMADPAFIHKIIVDQVLCFTTTLAFEASTRGYKILNEFDLVSLNLVFMALSHGSLMWMLAPSRPGYVDSRVSFQKVIVSLPNNVFDKSTKQKQHTLGQRIKSAIAKATQLSGVGAIAGTTLSVLGNATVTWRSRQDPEFHPSLPLPSLYRSAAGFGIFMGIDRCLHYQLINGIDRYSFDRVPLLPIYLAVSTLVRAISHAIGKTDALGLMGLPTDLGIVQNHNLPTKL